MEQAISEHKSPFATEPIGRLIAKFAIPCVISLLVNSLYNIVDQIFIGWGVGYLGNGATNVVFPITPTTWIRCGSCSVRAFPRSSTPLLPWRPHW